MDQDDSALLCKVNMSLSICLNSDVLTFSNKTLCRLREVDLGDILHTYLSKGVHMLALLYKDGDTFRQLVLRLDNTQLSPCVHKAVYVQQCGCISPSTFRSINLCNGDHMTTFSHKIFCMRNFRVACGRGLVACVDKLE